MRTKVTITNDDQYGFFSKMDIGYIEGYVRGADDRPYAAVHILRTKKIVLVSLAFLEVMEQ